LHQFLLVTFQALCALGTRCVADAVAELIRMEEATFERFHCFLPLLLACLNGQEKGGRISTDEALAANDYSKRESPSG
jgi:hypothetical protein